MTWNILCVVDSFAKQRPTQFKPITELYLYQEITKKNPKTIVKTIVSAAIGAKFILYTLYFSFGKESWGWK